MSTVISRVQTCVDAEIERQRQVLTDLGPDVTELLDVCSDLLAGGKRLRASFLAWGYATVAGIPAEDVPDDIIGMATAMEFFQAGALLHDDVMDGSDTRRGAPAAHVALASRHARRGWEGPPERFGLAGAVLAGNLCLTAADDLVARADLPDLGAARDLFSVMRTQLMAGQFLDVVESVRPWALLSTEERLARADRVIRFKSAKYSVEHPLLIGALAAHASQEQVAALSRYGLDVGRAFQLRDDLLGVFGDPTVTGKPAGDDLREGKRTVLIAATLDRLGTPDAERLLTGLGRDDADVVADLQGLIAGSGSVDWVEARITALLADALSALADARLTRQGYASLADLARQATQRAA
ncbi:MAG: polyprenyl synthetase family protein [Dermatophilaceae bacterium]|nr:polyprenyl synthetase family protein [Intrasporangiaceae bacterium]